MAHPRGNGSLSKHQPIAVIEAELRITDTDLIVNALLWSTQWSTQINRPALACDSPANTALRHAFNRSQKLTQSQWRCDAGLSCPLCVIALYDSVIDSSQRVLLTFPL